MARPEIDERHAAFPARAAAAWPGVVALSLSLSLSLGLGSASAQSLSCNGQLAGLGDSKTAVLQKCGQPVHRESVCVGSQGQPQLAVITGADGVLRQMLVPQCKPMEDWTFDRGSGRFTAVVRFQDDVVESVRDGVRTP